MEQLTKIGSFFKGNMGSIIPGALTGFGFLNNLFGQNRYNRQQDLAYNLAKDPAAAARYTQGFERPLTAGLTQGVENQVQAALGERGLTLSPAIAAATYSQALAPYIQNQQQLAAQEAMGYLGAGTSFPQARGSDVSGPLAALMQRLNQNPSAADAAKRATAVGADPNTGMIGAMPAGTYPDVWQWPTAPTWSPGEVTSAGGFATPDWTTILGGFSPTQQSQLFTPDLLTTG